MNNVYICESARNASTTTTTQPNYRDIHVEITKLYEKRARLIEKQAERADAKSDLNRLQSGLEEAIVGEQLYSLERRYEGRSDDLVTLEDDMSELKRDIGSVKKKILAVAHATVFAPSVFAYRKCTSFPVGYILHEWLRTATDSDTSIRKREAFLAESSTSISIPDEGEIVVSDLSGLTPLPACENGDLLVNFGLTTDMHNQSNLKRKEFLTKEFSADVELRHQFFSRTPKHTIGKRVRHLLRLYYEKQENRVSAQQKVFKYAINELLSPNDKGEARGFTDPNKLSDWSRAGSKDGNIRGLVLLVLWGHAEIYLRGTLELPRRKYNYPNEEYRRLMDWRGNVGVPEYVGSINAGPLHPPLPKPVEDALKSYYQGKSTKIQLDSDLVAIADNLTPQLEGNRERALQYIVTAVDLFMFWKEQNRLPPTLESTRKSLSTEKPLVSTILNPSNFDILERFRERLSPKDLEIVKEALAGTRHGKNTHYGTAHDASIENLSSHELTPELNAVLRESAETKWLEEAITFALSAADQCEIVADLGLPVPEHLAEAWTQFELDLAPRSSAEKVQTRQRRRQNAWDKYDRFLRITWQPLEVAAMVKEFPKKFPLDQVTAPLTSEMHNTLQTIFTARLDDEKVAFLKTKANSVANGKAVAVHEDDEFAPLLESIPRFIETLTPNRGGKLMAALGWYLSVLRSNGTEADNQDKFDRLSTKKQQAIRKSALYKLSIHLLAEHG